MSNMVFNWNNWIDSQTVASSASVSALSAQTNSPVANLQKAINAQFSKPTKTKKSAGRYGGYAIDLGEARDVRTVSLHRLLASTVRGRFRIQGGDENLLENPALHLDFLATETDGRTYPNTLDSRITFTRASLGMFWRGGELFGNEFVTRSSTALTTALTTWTVRAGGMWETGDLVYVLPQDGTANMSLTATVASYSGTTLTLTSITAGSDTTTTKTAFKIVYRGPRLDFTPISQQRRGLLIEGAATNLNTYSQEFTNDIYIETGVDRANNVGTAPDGSTTAGWLAEDGSNGVHSQYDDVTISADTVYSVSRWFRAAGRHQVQLKWGNTGDTNTISAVFDLRTGATPTASAAGSASSANAFVTRAPNGWVRCTVTGKIDGASTTGRTTVSLYNGSTSYVGEPDKGVLEWQAQVEASSFPTSDIPTVGAAVTRSADVATISGSSFTSWFTGADLGSILVSASTRRTSAANAVMFSLNDGGATNILDVYHQTDNQTIFRARASNSNVFTLSIGDSVDDVVSRCAVALGEVSAGTSGGRNSVTSSSFKSFSASLTTMNIGQNQAGGQHAYGHTREITFFPRRLPNARLEAWSKRGPTINSDFSACSVDLPDYYTFSRASGGTYIDSLGRIQGAYPSITQPIVPQTTREERVRNGHFNADELWTKGTGWTITGGQGVKAAGTGSNLTQTIATVPGQIYRLKATITRSAGTVVVDAGGTDLETVSASASVSTTFTASATTTAITFEGDSAFDGTVDAVSVTLDTGLRLPVGAGQDIKVGQLMRIAPQDGTADTYMIGQVVAYSGSIVTVDVVEAAAPELISNGHFTSATTGWTANNGTIAVSSAELEVTNDGAGNNGSGYQEITGLTSGATYVARAEAKIGTASSAQVRVGTAIGDTTYGSVSTTSSTNARATIQFTTSGTSAFVTLLNASGVSLTGYYDNVSLKRAHTNWIVSLAGPRFTHDPDDLTALGLLVEESRTNLEVDSEAMNAGAWTVSNASVTRASVDGPTGSHRAWKIEETSASGQHLVRHVTVSGLGASTVYSVSAWFKAAERTQGRLLFLDSTLTDGVGVAFDLSAGSASSLTFGAGSVSTFAIESWPNGWYRIWVVGSMNNGKTTGGIYINTRDVAGSDSFAGSTGSGFYIYGPQLEAGSFATSYIPTFGVSRTRSADICTIEGRQFTARYRSDANTIYSAGRLNTTTGTVLSVDDNTSNEAIEISASSGTLTGAVTDGGVSQASLSLGTITAGTSFAAAMRSKASDFAGVLDGGTVQTDSSGTMPAPDRLRVGVDQGGTYANGTIARLVLWAVGRTDTEIDAMTTSGADLSDYTLPGLLADAYAGDIDTGWLLNRRSYGTGDLPQGVSEFTRYVYGSDQSYRYWRVDMVEPLAPEADPPTTDDGLALEVGYLGIWQAHQFETNPDFDIVKGWRPASRKKRTLAQAKVVERRKSPRTWALNFPNQEETDADALEGATEFLGEDRACFLVLDPDDNTGFQRTDKLGTLTGLGSKTYTTFDVTASPLGLEEIVA